MPSAARRTRRGGGGGFGRGGGRCAGCRMPAHPARSRADTHGAAGGRGGRGGRGGGGGGGGRGGAPALQPGPYTVRLTVDGQTYTQPVTVKPDPRGAPGGVGAGAAGGN